VRGERDAIVSQAWVEEVTRLLPGGRLVVVPGAHTINYSAPRELVRVVRPFLVGGAENDGAPAARQSARA
jgi:hypothetical protein